METIELLWIIAVSLWIGIGYIAALTLDDSENNPLSHGSRLVAVVLGPIGAALYIVWGK